MRFLHCIATNKQSLQTRKINPLDTNITFFSHLEPVINPEFIKVFKIISYKFNIDVAYHFKELELLPVPEFIRVKSTRKKNYHLKFPSHEQVDEI
jgi:hypothetical protein